MVLRCGNKTRTPSLLQDSSRWAGWFDSRRERAEPAAARSTVLVCCLPFYSVLYHLLSVSINDCVLRPWWFIKLTLNYNMIIICTGGPMCLCVEGRLQLSGTWMGAWTQTEADKYNDQTRSEGNTKTKYTYTDEQTRNRWGGRRPGVVTKGRST